MGDIITIKHEGGTRFSAKARDFEAVTGKEMKDTYSTE